MANISHQIHSIDKLLGLFNANGTHLMVGILPVIISDKDFFVKPRIITEHLEPGYAYYGWASIENENHIIIQCPGRTARIYCESIATAIIAGEPYGCPSPAGDIKITPDLLEIARIYVEK